MVEVVDGRLVEQTPNGVDSHELRIRSIGSVRHGGAFNVWSLSGYFRSNRRRDNASQESKRVVPKCAQSDFNSQNITFQT